MRLTTKLVLALVGVGLLASACNAGGGAAPSGGGSAKPPSSSSSNSSITDGVMTTSVDDNSKPTGGVKTTFPPDIPAIFCSFKVSGVAQEDMIKATWIYVSGGGEQPDTVLNETYDIVQTAEASYYLAFYYDKPGQAWPKGDYKVVLSINNKEKLSVPFKVQ